MSAFTIAGRFLLRKMTTGSFQNIDLMLITTTYCVGTPQPAAPDPCYTTRPLICQIEINSS